MSGTDNPYGGSYGGQMTASAQLGGSEATNGAGGGYIKDTSTAAFTADVIEDSRRQPVLVDFWAPWCSEEHTFELQSLMLISYAVFCLKKKKSILILSVDYFYR